MVQCGVCGKFLGANVAAKCTKCNVKYHRSCVSLSETGAVGSKWICPGCKAGSHSPKMGTPSLHVSHVSPSPQAPSGLTAGDGEGLTIGLISEIREFRKELSCLRAEIREYRAENADFKSAVNDGLKDMDVRISALEKKIEQTVPRNVDALEDTISELKYQLNERDQDSLINDVEIAGVPEAKEENVLHQVKVLVLKLGLDVDDKDIVHAERVGSTRRNRIEDGPTGSATAGTDTHRPRPITVRFSRRVTRDHVLRAARVRRSLTSADMQVQGPPRRVYINEHLTISNRRLFYQARQAGNQYHWKYVWTHDGKILARKEDGKAVERIRTAKDLVRVFGTCTV